MSGFTGILPKNKLSTVTFKGTKCQTSVNGKIQTKQKEAARAIPTNSSELLCSELASFS